MGFRSNAGYKLTATSVLVLTGPSRKLQIDNSSGVGEAVISGTTGATLYFRPNTSYSVAGNFGIFTTGLTSGTYESTMDFKGYYNGVTTPLTIKGSGNVGIGTDSPDAQLEISNNNTTSGAGGATLRLTRADGTSVAGDPVGTIEFYSTDADTPKTTAYIKSMSEELYGREGSLAFGVSQTINADATEVMRIDSNGNVGIGTTSPAKQLQVRGDAPWIRIEEDSASNKRLDLWVDTSSAIAYVGANQSAQQLSFQTASSDRIRILNNGNVGIGTTAPTNKLHVTGTIYGNGGIIGSSDLWLRDQASAYSTELKMQNNTHTIGIDYQNNETLRFITRSGTTTVPITFAMRTGNITCVSLTQTSDERKKTKIKDLSGDNIDVRWRSFEMKANEGEYRAGVIAQELEQNHPEFVNTDDEGLKSVKYIDLLIAKIAELETRIKQLENN